MRALILLIGLLATGIAFGQGQDTKRLEQIAARLRQDGIELVYSSDRVDPGLSVGFRTSILEQLRVLEQSLITQGLTLTRVRPNFFVITPIRHQDDDQAVVLTGTVRDAITGRAVAGAQIQVGEGKSARSDGRGLFLVTGLAVGVTTVRVRAPGYLDKAPRSLEMVPETPRFLELVLQPLPVDLGRVMISASHFNLAWPDESAGTYLSASDLLTQPSLGDDPLRAVNRLPGIAGSGLSARSRIRGGDANETLLVLDGQPLVDPFHLKGFQGMFSAVNAATLEAIDYYAGGFPIEYGNRLSGVVHLTSREVAPSRLYEVGIGLFDSYLLAAGHDQGEDNSYLASYRRGGLDLALRLLENDFGKPEYHDAYFRYEHQIDPDSSLRLAWLLSRDEISLNSTGQSEQAEADSRDSYFWLTYLRELSTGGSLAVTLSSLSFSGNRSGQFVLPEAVSGTVVDDRDSEGFGIRVTYEQLLRPRWHLRAGTAVRHLDAKYQYLANSQVLGPLGQIDGTLGPANGELASKVDGLESSVWAGLRWQATNQLLVETGVRWDDFDYLDLEEEEQFSVRANGYYRPWEGTTLRASWGQFRQAQGIEELHVEFGESDFQPPQLAEHTVLSWDQDLPSGLALRIEAYQKRVTNPWRRVELLYDPLVLLPDLHFDRVEVLPTSAKARGLEITLRGGNEVFNWWLAFTRAKVAEQVEGRNIPRSWDQAYAGTGGLEWTHGNWTWSAAANYHDGWPTALLQQSEQGDLSTTPRNSQRFDDFATIDLRASRQYPLATGHLRVYFELSNLLNRDNPCCTEYRLGGAGQLQAKQEHWLPVIPSFGVVWSNQ